MADYDDPENTILIELKDGTVAIKLLPDVAPEHCKRMKELARGGEYDNVVFHRVIDDFMAQTGDCLLYTSPSPRDQRGSRMPSSA